MPAVLEHVARLLLVERDFFLLFEDLAVLRIGEALYMLAADDGLLHYLFAVGGLHLDVEPALRLDADERPHLAEAVASGFFEADGIVVRLLRKLDLDLEAARLHNFLEFVVDDERAARNAARAGADEDFLLFPGEARRVLLSQLPKLFARFDNHIKAPS